eukprot:scaffold2305_cov145-Skeletonema_menzelii.AAC.7
MKTRASNFNNYLPLDAQDVVQRTIYERVKLQMGIVWALSAGGWKGAVESTWCVRGAWRGEKVERVRVERCWDSTLNGTEGYILS